MMHPTTPIALWRDSMCLWLRMTQANAELALRMWQTMGLRFPHSPDSDVEAICTAAAKPANVPDPVKPRARAKPARKADPAPAG